MDHVNHQAQFCFVSELKLQHVELCLSYPETEAEVPFPSENQRIVKLKLPLPQQEQISPHPNLNTGFSC